MALFYCFRKLLLRGLGSLDSLDQHGSDLEQVAADAVVGDLEDRRGVVLTDTCAGAERPHFVGHSRP